MTAVLVLAKAPVAGAVKTRLCPPCTPAQAADLAAAALLDSLAAARSVPGGVAVAVLAGDLHRAARRAALDGALRGMPVLVQRGAGLGARIAAAHRDAAALLPGRATLQIGMDTPQAGPMLADAAALLHHPGTDAVLGRAADGGWWALGLRDPAAATLVADVPTSRDDTGERTLAALRGAGLRVASLPELIDVDTVADARAVAAAAPATRFAGAVRALPATTRLAAGTGRTA
ncbi:MAG: TIGR04282 family arsenosugar biosynthesis glycosyltransferase [Pseudonocardia sp.]